MNHQDAGIAENTTIKFIYIEIVTNKVPQGIVQIIKGFFTQPNPCEKLIRYEGSKVEVSASGEVLGVNLDLKNISKEIQEITPATDYAKILDDYQYLLCKEIVRTSSDKKFSDTLTRFRIITVGYITQISLIMKQIQDGLIEGLKEELIRLIQNMRELISNLEKTLLK
jgi:hypothetical protein